MTLASTALAFLLVRALTKSARLNPIDCVAKGVECAAILQRMFEFGTPLFQGYYLTRTQPLTAVERDLLALKSAAQQSTWANRLS